MTKSGEHRQKLSTTDFGFLCFRPFGILSFIDEFWPAALWFMPIISGFDRI